MRQWVIKGLRTGVKTTRYPRREEHTPGVSPGFPTATELSAESAGELAARCPTGALEPMPKGINVHARRCIHCFRCVRSVNSPVAWNHGYEWASVNPDAQGRARESSSAFARSLHVMVVDAGDCGACLNEVKQLNNPYYNMHRLGFFFTPTPRHADVLLVVGALTEHMRLPLRKAYDAVPEPKWVMAVGACALSGGIFGRTFICAGGISEFLPVDVEVPGNPPPPLAILHGLLVAAGRRPPASSGLSGAMPVTA